MIKYYVRTTLERKLDDSYNQIEYELLIDKEHKLIPSFINSLITISDYDSVLMEDDLILCSNFKEEIEKVIKQYPNYIINFFQLPDRYITTHLTNTSFRYNQCTYYPKGVGKLLAQKALTYRINERRNGCDVVQDWAMKDLDMIYVIYRPCLVQHLDKKSLIWNNSAEGQRRSPYFIDYLKELNIDYLDAGTKENKEKLIALMNKHFNQNK